MQPAAYAGHWLKYGTDPIRATSSGTITHTVKAFAKVRHNSRIES